MITVFFVPITGLMAAMLFSNVIFLLVLICHMLRLSLQKEGFHYFFSKSTFAKIFYSKNEKRFKNKKSACLRNLLFLNNLGSFNRHESNSQVSAFPDNIRKTKWQC